ncbi:putative bifunctional diguanylate cyclase/phosphodiesterase [Brucellaceae bacterium C25G]
MIEAPNEQDQVVDNDPEAQTSDTETVTKANDLYRREEAFIRYALDCAAIVAITDVKGTITYVNNKFCQISGYSRDELIGSNHRMLKSGYHSTEFFKDMYRQVGKGNVWHGEICNKNKSGKLYWVDTTIVPHKTPAGKIDTYTAIRFDISAQKMIEAELRENKQHLYELANIDALTGLANRRRFQTYLADALVTARIQKKRLSLALIDLDAFKDVNDSFGHDVGDSLLVTVASTIKAALKPPIFVTRLGGDEFGIVYNDTDQSDVLISVNYVLNQIRTIQTDKARSKHCSASVGIAHFPLNAEDTTSLFKAADIALYTAKSSGRNRIETFKQELMTALEKRITLLRNIAIGLESNQFELYYQPIVSVKHDRKIAFEALLRWNQPNGDVWNPSHFLLGLEDTQTSQLIGQFVLNRVFDDAVNLRAQGVDFEFLAINLTNADLVSDNFINRFIELAANTQISPFHFCVEITERMLLSADKDRIYSQLKKLTDLGVKVAFDDFGTGYASLTHLRELTINHVKIDRSFVENIATSNVDQAIIEGVIHISHKMGKRVVVEGVETSGQLEILRQMDCDDIQGFLFSPPQPLSALRELVTRLEQTSY